VDGELQGKSLGRKRVIGSDKGKDWQQILGQALIREELEELGRQFGCKIGEGTRFKSTVLPLPKRTGNLERYRVTSASIGSSLPFSPRPLSRCLRRHKFLSALEDVRPLPSNHI
jgi:hypothetical protein